MHVTTVVSLVIAAAGAALIAIWMPGLGAAARRAAGPLVGHAAAPPGGHAAAASAGHTHDPAAGHPAVAVAMED
jgi:hypothetical protein